MDKNRTIEVSKFAVTPATIIPNQTIINGSLSKLTLADQFVELFERNTLFINNKNPDPDAITLLIKWTDLLDIYIQLMLPYTTISSGMEELIRFIEMKMRIPKRTLFYAEVNQLIEDFNRVNAIANHNHYILCTRKDVDFFVNASADLRRYQNDINQINVLNELALKPISISERIEPINDEFVELVHTKMSDVINTDQILDSSSHYSGNTTGLIRRGTIGVYKADFNFNASRCEENFANDSYLRQKMIEWSQAIESTLSLSKLCVPLINLSDSIFALPQIQIEGIDVNKSILDQNYDAVITIQSDDPKYKTSLLMIKSVIGKETFISYNSEDAYKKLITLSTGTTPTLFAFNVPILKFVDLPIQEFADISAVVNGKSLNSIQLSTLADTLKNLWRKITTPIRNFNFSVAAATFVQKQIIPVLKKKYNLTDEVIATFDTLLQDGPGAFADPKVRSNISNVLYTSIIPTLIKNYADSYGKGDIPKTYINKLYDNLRSIEINRIQSLPTLTNIKKRNINLVKNLNEI